MKKVHFNPDMDTQPVIEIEYDRIKLIQYIRDKLIPWIIQDFNKKLIKEELSDSSAVNTYIDLILNKALENDYSNRDLLKKEFCHNKFNFLPYEPTSAPTSYGRAITLDDSIHKTAFTIVALCKGYPKIVGDIISPSMLLDSKIRSCKRKYIGDKKAEYVCADVSELTKKCVAEMLTELHTTGQIKSYAEVVGELAVQDPPLEELPSTENTAYEESSGNGINNFNQKSEGPFKLNKKNQDGNSPSEEKSHSSSSQNTNTAIHDNTVPSNLLNYNTNLNNNLLSIFKNTEPALLNLVDSTRFLYGIENILTEKQAYDEIIKEIEEQLEANFISPLTTLKQQNITNSSNNNTSITSPLDLTFTPILPSEFQEFANPPFSITADPIILGHIEDLSANQLILDINNPINFLQAR